MGRVLPILFNTDMVRAILDGRKTVTRRAIKRYIPDDAVFGYTVFTPKGHISCRGTWEDGYGEKFFELPFQKWDVLYVRETYCPNYFDFVTPYGNKHGYKADYDRATLSSDITEPRWTPSIHMPKEAARIWLNVTDVRVERLCSDILEADCIEEGISPYKSDMTEKTEIEIEYEFEDLWNSTIKKSDYNLYGFDADPWVWVIKFERCEKPEGN